MLDDGDDGDDDQGGVFGTLARWFTSTQSVCHIFVDITHRRYTQRRYASQTVYPL